jgi:hypothetical protein
MSQATPLAKRRKRRVKNEVQSCQEDTAWMCRVLWVLRQAGRRHTGAGVVQGRAQAQPVASIQIRIGGDHAGIWMQTNVRAPQGRMGSAAAKADRARLLVAPC